MKIQYTLIVKNCWPFLSFEYLNSLMFELIMTIFHKFNAIISSYIIALECEFKCDYLKWMRFGTIAGNSDIHLYARPNATKIVILFLWDSIKLKAHQKYSWKKIFCSRIFILLLLLSVLYKFVLNIGII